MAITIQKYPCQNDSSSSPRLHPVGNPIVYVVSSPNTGETNFRFVAKVLDENDTVLSTLKQLPDFTTGLGIFNLSDVLRSYVSSAPNFISTGVTNYTSAAKKYRVNFYEEYVYEWDFYDNFFVSSPAELLGNVGFTGNTQHTFVTGDTIYVNQTAGYTHEEYNGFYTIVYIPDNNSVVVNNVFQGSTPAEPGTISDGFGRRTLVTNSSAQTDYSYAIDSTFSHVNWLSYSAKTYTTTPNVSLLNTNGNFFTNAPLNYYVREDSHMELNIFSKSNSANTTCLLKYILYDDHSNMIASYSFSGLTTSVDRLNKVICGPGDYSGRTDNGGNRVDFSGASYYFTFLTDETNLINSAVFVFKIDNTCSRYDNIQLLFKDRKGSYLPANFQLVTIESISEIERNSYNQNIGSYQSNNWKYNTYDRGIKTYNVNRNRSYICNSNWLTETDANYWEDLWTSSDVYAKIDGNWLPIIITDTSFIKKTRNNTGLIQYSINFIIANNE